MNYAVASLAVTKTLRVANTLICLGLNLVIERFDLDRRWQYLLWLAIAVNEARGLLIVFELGRATLHAMWSVLPEAYRLI